MLAFAAQVPGARVLPDRFAVAQQRLTLAPGRSAASLALASDVTRQALASGLVRASIERHGLVGVRPPRCRARCPGRRPDPTGRGLGAGLVAAAGALLAAGWRR